MRETAVERLLKIERNLEELRQKPELTPIEQEYLDMFSRYLADEPLVSACDLDLRHGDPRNHLRRHRAYELLYTIARRYFPDETPRSQGIKIAQAMLRYRADVWPRECGYSTCPSNRIGSIEGDLWKYFRLHPELLKADTIRRYLAFKSTSYSQPNQQPLPVGLPAAQSLRQTQSRDID